MYEITYNETKMGFSVIKDEYGQNAIVSSIKNEFNKEKGLKIGSIIVNINGTNVEGWSHSKILNQVSSIHTTPSVIVFKKVNFIHARIRTFLKS